MKSSEFKIVIDAPPKNVWDVLLGADTYPEWTSVFMQGSRVESVNPAESQIWKKGNKVRFLGPDNEGMVSTIAENKPNEYLSIKHLGVVKDGKDNYDTPWSGSLENYTLKPVGNRTELIIDMDITPEYKEYFESAWPKALSKIKDLAEKQNIVAH
jgi:uncharacterized protein YndB with AHSA1/START domain